MKTNCCAVACLLLLFTVAPAFAWNALGHKVVAELAWRQLTPEQRQSIVDTLRRHPRFDKDFAEKMDDNSLTGDKAVEDHWVFLHAATWPDIIRKVKPVDQPTWHYIDLPIFLTPQDQQVFAGKLPVNIATDYPTQLPENEYNIVQAIAHCKAALRSKGGPEVKSVAYCWLFHLVGDIHQPLHGSALFNSERLPQGDKGGNSIPLVRGKNLHALWDELLGRDAYLRNVSRAANDLSDKERYGSIWQSAADITDPRKWAEESHGICESAVYVAAVLADVKESPMGAKIEAVDLPESYYKAAGEQARKQVLKAGLRLGQLLGKVAP